jgi:hypothetical protein
MVAKRLECVYDFGIDNQNNDGKEETNGKDRS